jgi:hypothetical protein
MAKIKCPSVEVVPYVVTHLSRVPSGQATTWRYIKIFYFIYSQMTFIWCNFILACNKVKNTITKYGIKSEYNYSGV